MLERNEATAAPSHAHNGEAPVVLESVSKQYKTAGGVFPALSPSICPSGAARFRA